MMTTYAVNHMHLFITKYKIGIYLDSQWNFGLGRCAVRWASIYYFIAFNANDRHRSTETIL
jgi:hypothetical protein